MSLHRVCIYFLFNCIGLDSSTAFELCKNLHNITQEQQLTVAAVIHSPSPATFRQFDDLMLLGKGGRLIYFGPISDASEYFEKIGFSCPPGESLADFLMDIVNGKLENALPLAALYDAWNNHSQRKSDMKELSMEIDSSHSPFHQKGSYSLFRLFRQMKTWILDVLSDYKRSLFSVYRSVSNTPDPIRDTCPFYLQTWYLTRRAFRQNFNKPYTVFIDVILHYGIGAFIGIAINSYSYLGQFPLEICISQANDLKKACLAPDDGMMYFLYMCL